MISKNLQGFKNIATALSAPEKFFAKQDNLKISLLSLILCLYLISLSASLLSFSIMNRPAMKQFALEMSVRETSKTMIGASEEDKAFVREEMRAKLNSPFNKIMGYIATSFSPLFRFISVLIFWGLQNISTRFFGGEEHQVSIQRKKGPVIRKHHRSLVLSFLALLPLAIESLVKSLILVFRNPDYFLNVLSMQDLNQKMNIDISLSALLVNADMMFPVKTILSIITNPFYWWMFYICWFGMKEIWHIKKSGIITTMAIWFFCTAMFRWFSYSMVQTYSA